MKNWTRTLALLALALVAFAAWSLWRPRPGSDWREEYARASLEELEAERHALQKEYLERATPELRERFDRGQFEVVGSDSKYRSEAHDNAAVSSVMLLPKSKGGEVRRATLPEEQYPELWETREKIEWIDARIAEKQSALRAAKLAEHRATQH